MPNDFFLAEVPADACNGGIATGVTIVVCRSCRFGGSADAAPRPGALLAGSVRGLAAGTGVQVKEASCLGNCKRALSAAILRERSWSYVFGGLDAASAEDLMAGALLFASSRDGLMPFGARPEALKRGLVARIPSSDNLETLP